MRRRRSAVTLLAIGLGISGCSATPVAVDRQPIPTVPTIAIPTTTTQPTPDMAPGTTLFDQAGSGVVSTRSFDAPAEWKLDWTYNCPQSVFATGLTVYVNGALQDGPLMQTVPSGSGTQYYHQGGTIWLQVVSACPWTLRASAGS